MDLVQKKLPIQSSDQILQENKYLSKQGSWNQAFVIQNPVVIAEVEKDSNGKPTGYSNKVDYNIVNVGAMTLDKAYIAELDSEYESVFNNPNVSQAQKQQYLIDIGIVENIKSIQNRTPEEQKKLIMDAMGENIWEGYFPEKYVSSGTGSQQIQKQLGTYNEKTKQFDLDEADKALLKSIQDQGIKNPMTGELYQEGESIYVIRTEKSRVTPKPSSDDAVDQYSYFYNMSDEELINSLTDAPLSVTGRGTYLVNPNGDIVRNTGGDDPSDFPIIVKKDQNPKKFRDILLSASNQQRNK